MPKKRPEFVPDYENAREAAKNRKPKRLPLYEHLISDTKMEEIMGKRFREYSGGDAKDKREYLRNYCEFFKRTGYDTVSFECCIGPAMPGSGCLGAHKPPAIKDRGDFNRYPWGQVYENYFAMHAVYFESLREVMPAGMKAIGGVGNGIFECVQDITGYMNLCFIKSDDPELYADLFKKVGEVSVSIWREFLRLYGDIYCVPRFGDDLGYKSNTLVSAEDIKSHIIPQYAKIIELVHSYGKPFLLHSCGNLFGVMRDMIETAKIDAKHSNEDQIAPFPVWVEKYGKRVAFFGGIDTDAVCRLSFAEIREYVNEVLAKCEPDGGVAFGSGNSIPDYVPAANYLEMVEAVREYRGE